MIYRAALKALYVNETFSFETETRPRPRPTFRGPDRDVFRDVANGTIQPVKLLASNCYKLCRVSFIYYAIHSSV